MTSVVGARRHDARRRGLFAELAEGLRWVYQHRMVAPLAIATHV
ncbi:MAG TPA: hypothetical protein VFS93_00595 [Terrimesophilobacter sp.]|nr:hypothetical protein [Terrimesophilobacter sp.]